MPANADSSELVFSCCICYFDRMRFVCCCHIVWPFMPLASWMIKMKKKMHLCSSRDHHSRRIDRICMCIKPRHHGCMCVDVHQYVAALPTRSCTSIQEAQPLPLLHVASTSPLLAAAATISTAQKPQDSKQCAGRHRTGTRTLLPTWLTKLERRRSSGTTSR